VTFPFVQHQHGIAAEDTLPMTTKPTAIANAKALKPNLEMRD
jgi:hypothetical protein